MRVVGVILRALFVLDLLAFIAMSLWVRGTATAHPDAISGRVWPVNDHGQTKHVTQLDYIWVQSIPWLAVATVCVGLAGFVIYLARRGSPKLRAALKLVTAASVIAWVFSYQWLYFNRPHQPEPSTGHLWSVPFRGDTYYLTLFDYAVFIVALPLIAALCVLSLMATGAKPK